MQTVTKALTLIIVDPLVISTASALPTGVKDAAYSQTLAATGGTAPYTWSIASGSLPSLLILNTSGAIGGIPTTVGTLESDHQRYRQQCPFTDRAKDLHVGRRWSTHHHNGCAAAVELRGIRLFANRDSFWRQDTPTRGPSPQELCPRD